MTDNEFPVPLVRGLMQQMIAVLERLYNIENRLEMVEAVVEDDPEAREDAAVDVSLNKAVNCEVCLRRHADAAEMSLVCLECLDPEERRDQIEELESSRKVLEAARARMHELEVLMRDGPAEAARVEERRACLDAARSASLPSDYQWGAEARSAFEFGKDRAMRAIQARGRSIDEVVLGAVAKAVGVLLAEEEDGDG